MCSVVQVFEVSLLRGYFVDSAEGLAPALEAANAGDGPAIVHIAINPRAGRKPQQFQWHTGRTG